MTVEQKAEEIANKRCHEIMCFGHCNFSSPKHHRCGEWHREYNCALDGYHECQKEHEWHDLEKDPTDLPKHTNSVLGYCRGDYYDVCFFNGKRLIGHGESDFLKWKEIE